MLSEPIVRLLFQHGAFTAADTAATAQALMWLALGLPAHVLIKALSPAFFAREDTRTPLWATLKGFAVAIVLAVVLGHVYGASGIAAAIALGAWSSALSLIRRGAATFGFSIDAAARRRLPRIVAAALVMGGLLWLAAAFAAARGGDRTRPRAGRAAGSADRRRNRGLRRASGPVRRHQLGRSEQPRSGKAGLPACATRPRVAMDGASRLLAMDGAKQARAGS